MRYRLRGIRTVMIAILVLFIVGVTPTTGKTEETIVWEETWEGDWDADWVEEEGLWEVGAPSSGPGATFAGQNCAGTVLGGLYPPNIDRRLRLEQSLVVPPASENPRLRFWHWFGNAARDAGVVEVRVDGGAGEWEALSVPYAGSGGTWSRTSLDLSDYAEQSIRIAFRFQSSGTRSDTGAGWYVDDVALITGTPRLRSVEAFERGLDEWSVERGVWEVGAPDRLPAPRTFGGGEACAATILNGDYPQPQDSRLVTPKFTVPASTENPRLRFWHAFTFAAGDSGRVEIRQGATDWEPLGPTYTGLGSVWSHARLDLTAFAGEEVQIGFRLISSSRTPQNDDVALGWYVDEVGVETGQLAFRNEEDFEQGLGDWSVERGVWEIGSPRSGPLSTISARQCMATDLHGDYHNLQDSRLVSPSLTVSEASDYPRLRFWHWYRFAAGDSASVELRRRSQDGTPGEWTTVTPEYTGFSGVWTRAAIDLREYAGETVEFAFRFVSEARDALGGDVADGWFVDDVHYVTGAPEFREEEEVSEEIGDWSVERGIWEIDRDLRNNYYFQTTTGGNFGQPQESRLLTPLFRVPSSESPPHYAITQVFEFGAGDAGVVEVREGRMEWRELQRFEGSSGDLVRPTDRIDLSEFAGKEIQLAFRVISASKDPFGLDVGAHWQLDRLWLQPRPYLAGDVNSDATVNLTDALLTLNFLFVNGARPACDRGADFDGDQALTLSDPLSTVNFLFLNGPPPPGPFPNCGRGEHGFPCEVPCRE